MLFYEQIKPLSSFINIWATNVHPQYTFEMANRKGQTAAACIGATNENLAQQWTVEGILSGKNELLSSLQSREGCKLEYAID